MILRENPHQSKESQPSLKRPNIIMAKLTALFSLLAISACDGPDEGADQYLQKQFKNRYTGNDREKRLGQEESRYQRYHDEKERMKKDNKKYKDGKILASDAFKELVNEEVDLLWQAAKKLKPLLKLLRNNRWILQTKLGKETRDDECMESDCEKNYSRVLKVMYDDNHDLIITRKQTKASTKGDYRDTSEELTLLVQNKSGTPVLEFIYLDNGLTKYYLGLFFTKSG